MAEPILAEQARMLRFLAEHPKWHTFLALDRHRLLHPDDTLYLPALIKRGLVERWISAGCVRITPSGQALVAAREPPGIIPPAV